MSEKLQVWKITDCDWYAATSFSEAVNCAIADGTDKESVLDSEPPPLTEQELREMKIGDADDGLNGDKISGWEHLQRIATTDRAAVFFASTEY